MPLTQAKSLDHVFTKQQQVRILAPRDRNIAEPAPIKHLRVTLQLLGVTFIFGIYALTIVWPSGWA